MNDPLETIRRLRQSEINAHPHSRQELEAQYGQVWDTEELGHDFEVLGFLAPFVVVKRRLDGAIGSLEFQHHPRVYYDFELDGR